MVAPQNFPTFLNTAFSRHYLNPQKYHRYVLRNGRRQLASEVVKHLKPLVKPKSSVLELAAGTGILSTVLAGQGYEVWATDHDLQMLKAIPTHSRIHKHRMDFNNPFPVKSDTFNAVTILWGNRYIKNPARFLNQIHRILMPGGFFIWPVFTIELPLWIYLSHPYPLPSVKNLTLLSQKAGFESRYLSPDNPLSTRHPGFLVLKKT